MLTWCHRCTKRAGDCARDGCVACCWEHSQRGADLMSEPSTRGKAGRESHVGWQRAIEHAVAHVAHLLPDQAPIRVFIHHNTLHALQHLHFHEALSRAHQVYGAEPYLSEA